MNDARNAHLAALGLVRNPFPYTPDAGCYFLTPHLQEQVMELAHCITARKGISLLTAEVGMGKSTLVRRLMAGLAGKNVVSALVFNTFLQGPELLAAVLQDFGLSSAGSMAADINILNTFLLDNHRAGKTCLLVIDDAQNLSASSLELVRLLCNLETDQEKLLQILLAGQPELEETLSQHSLRQLRSRLVKHARLHGLHSTEIADYVKFRFESSGSDGTLQLAADACQMLWRETRGVPRHVHLIMDRCLYGLAARQARVIDAGLMREAIEDSRVTLGITDTPSAAAEEPVRPPPASQAARPAAPRRAVAYAAVAAGVLLAGAVGLRLGVGTAAVSPAQATVADAVAPAPTPPAPVEPAVQAEATEATETTETVDVADAAEPVAHCVTPAVGQPDRLAWRLPLPEKTNALFGARLARLDGVCLEHRSGQTWVNAVGPLAGHAMSERVVAARFQIALTRFGSLPTQEVDGLWGERSRRALAQFQQEVGLAPTGEADALSGLLLERFYAQ